MKDVNENMIKAFVKIMAIVAKEAKRNFPKEYAGVFYVAYAKNSAYISQMHVSLLSAAQRLEVIPVLIKLNDDEIALAIGLAQNEDVEDFIEAQKEFSGSTLVGMLEKMDPKRVGDLVLWLAICHERLITEEKRLVVA